MKFSDYHYERPNYMAVKKQLHALITTIKTAQTAKDQLAAVKEVNDIRRQIETMSTLASIRHKIDTRDAFYDEEKRYWNEHQPLFEALTTNYYEALLSSTYRHDLERVLGTQFFKLMEVACETFSPEVISDLQEENRLCSQYTKLVASARLQFNGEVLTLAGLGKYLLHHERDVRQAASKVKYAFFQTHESTFDQLFDQLVNVRTKIAQTLGFNNFVELGYKRMQRMDYTPELVQNFRQQVLEHLVPVATELYEQQRKRVGYDVLKFYDEKHEYKDGNPTPKGDSKWIIEKSLQMFQELSLETKAFFELMVERQLLDLDNKPGKAGGGFCSYLPSYKVPFIFTNFNQTAGDIDVLTHEAGHAFQKYESSWIEIPEILSPTYETRETHSMSMEFFTWPWMELFLKRTLKNTRNTI